MDRYTKAFVVASLVYLVAAAGLGVWMASGDRPGWAYFGHVHFNLLGFMAMMVYGVGYFILPRFNARPLRWPRLLGVHFVVSNLGLLGMVATSTGRPSAGFTFFSALSLISAGFFALNLGDTILLPAGGEKPEEEPDAEAEPPISEGTRVGEILSRWPGTASILAEGGLTPLADPAHQEKVKKLPVTIGMACANHGVDIDAMLARLNAAVGGGSLPSGPPAALAGNRGPARGGRKMGSKIGPNHVIGEVLKDYPSTETVFRKYYGAACFSCPGQATETVRQSTLMHNVDEGKLLKELNEAAGL